MIIYLVVFVLSAIFFSYSEYCCRRREKIVCILIGIMLPAILAGCRGASIGTDVQVYGIWHYKTACVADHFMQYFSSVRNSLFSELLYHFLVYGLSRFFSNYHWGLFAYSLLTISFTYAGMNQYKKQMNTPLWLGMLLYYFAFYNTTLNAMRQSIAVSIVFFASAFLFEKRYTTFFLLIILGTGFHTSAMLGLLLLPMYLILRQGRSVTLKRQCFQSVLFICCVCGALLFGSLAVRFLVNNGIIRSNYLNYLSGGLFSASKIKISALLVYLGYIFLYLVHYKYLMRHSSENLFFLAISFVVFLSRIGQVISVFLPRVGYYFIPLQMVSMANITNCYSKKSKIFWITVIIFYLFLTWFGMYVYIGSSDTVPYILDIRG